MKSWFIAVVPRSLKWPNGEMVKEVGERNNNIK